MSISVNALNRPGTFVSIFKDRVVTLILILLIAIFFIDSNQAVDSTSFVGKALFHISPFFILAVSEVY